jgi:poly-gamma-glutamate synthesis protein (capsule biosynthesis protein)
MIDAGADAIIGHHPHVVQGMEIYKQRPIFYSLGNFIFDQYFSAETQEGLGLGLNFADNKLKVEFYPFKSDSSHPRLMEKDEKSEFFKNLFSWSDLSEENKDDILAGELLLDL